MRTTLMVFLALATLAMFPAGGSRAETALPNPQVVIATDHGKITLRLFRDKAPVTVENFLAYVDEGSMTARYFTA